MKYILFFFFFFSSCLPLLAQNDLYIASPGTFYTHPNSNVAVFGNVINDAAGGLNHMNGGDFYLFRHSGSGPSRIYDGPNANPGNTRYNGNGSYVRIYNFHSDNTVCALTPGGTLINMSYGNAPIQIEQETRISGLHSFENGMIWTPRGNWQHAFLLYEQSASYSGNSNSKHIDGYAGFLGAGNFDFPIGDGIYQRISGVVNGANGEYKSAYFNKNAQNGTAGLSGPSASTGPMNGGIVKVDATEFWDIDGTAPSQFKLAALNSVAGYSDWNTLTNFYGSYAAQIVITAWDAWENLGMVSLPLSLVQDGNFVTSVVTNPDGGNAFGTGYPFSAYTWAIAPFSDPLALNLTDFTATEKNCRVTLQWKAVGETGAGYFEIQQKNGDDSFTTVATVAAKTTPDNGNDHTYMATIPVAGGLSVYRIRSNDGNGKYRYSSSLSLRSDCGSAADYIFLYPDPAAGNEVALHCRLGYKGAARVCITNIMGQLVKRNTVIVTEGVNRVPINIASLAAGSYYVQLLSDKGMLLGETQKLIKK